MEGERQTFIESRCQRKLYGDTAVSELMDNWLVICVMRVWPYPCGLICCIGVWNFMCCFN